MDRNRLKEVILDQKDTRLPKDFVNRKVYGEINRLSENSLILIISGIRRCGKSTLLQLIRSEQKESSYYINFDDDRLVEFSLEDFQVLYETFIEIFGEEDTFYFDEIQNIPGWERFVRRLHDQDKKVYITGSNASMLSRELGTRLTGRHITINLYPFSFEEYIEYKDASFLKKNLDTKTKAKIKKLFNDYIKVGGIPEYIRLEEQEYLRSLYDNLLYRDIITRYKLQKELELKKLCLYIASNIGKNFTYNSLRKLLGLGNSHTVAEYLGYFENCFLSFVVNRYNRSLRKQTHSEKKVYFIDLALAKTVGFRSSEDAGRGLENIVYIELKRRKHEVYVHKETKECDFVIHEGNRIVQAIQVCKEFSDQETRDREYNGLLEAMNMYELDTGLILTEYDEDQVTIEEDGKMYKIEIVPIWKWLLDRS